MADAATTAFNISITLSVVINLVMIALFGIAYMYMAKLEKVGCACAVHKYRDFVKYFPIFAIVYLLLTMFNPLFVRKNPALAGVFAIMSMLYTIGAVVFFVCAIQYVRFLVAEKCKCSEDVSREVLYYWSIFHLVIIALALLAQLLLIVSAAVFMAKIPDLKHISDAHAHIGESVRTPQKSLAKLPGRFKKLVA
jgi:hypothetical protein